MDASKIRKPWRVLRFVEMIFFYTVVGFLLFSFVRNYLIGDKDFRFGTFRVYETYAQQICYPVFKEETEAGVKEIDRWILLGYQDKNLLPRNFRTIESSKELSWQVEEICRKKEFRGNLRLSYYCSVEGRWVETIKDLAVCRD